MDKYRTLSLSLSELEDFAKRFAGLLSPPCSVSLIGQLGAGKTTFVKAVVAALGIPEDVSSPSFVLQHEYHNDSVTVEHWDLYRLGSETEDLLEPPSEGVLRMVEWGDYAPSDLFDVSVRFIVDGESQRVLEIEAPFANELGLTA